MSNWTHLTFAGLSLAVATAALSPSGCYSSQSSPPTPDAACTPVDATLTGSLAAGSGACNTCIQQMCGSEVASCSTECTCNDTATTALACIEALGGNASVAAESTCVAPLAGSSDTTLSGLGSCMLTMCAAACGANPVDAGSCDAVAQSLTTLLQSGAGSCGACLQGKCTAATSSCASDCTCNAAAVTALDCLANLGDGATIGSASACVGALAGASGTSVLASVGSCLVMNCLDACGAGADAGPGAEAGADASTDAGGAEASADASEAAASCTADAAPYISPEAGFEAGAEGGVVCSTALATSPGMVQLVAKTMSPPMAAGGTIVSGTYFMTSFIDYSAPSNGTGASFAEGLVINVAPTCTGQAGTAEGILNGYQGVSTFAYDFTAGGFLAYQFHASPACGFDGGSLRYGTNYTATPTALLLFNYLGTGTVEVATFTKQ